MVAERHLPLHGVHGKAKLPPLTGYRPDRHRPSQPSDTAAPTVESTGAGTINLVERI
jgi:hypothetical protein